MNDLKDSIISDLMEDFRMGDDAFKVVNVQIHTPKNSLNSYIYDEDTDKFALNKVFSQSYSFERGELLLIDEALESIVLITNPTFVGANIPTKIIGAVSVDLEDYSQEVLVGVSIADKSFENINEFSDLSPEQKQEIETYLKEATESEKFEWLNAQEAQNIVRYSKADGYENILAELESEEHEHEHHGEDGCDCEDCGGYCQNEFDMDSCECPCEQCLNDDCVDCTCENCECGNCECEKTNN